MREIRIQNSFFAAFDVRVRHKKRKSVALYFASRSIYMNVHENEEIVFMQQCAYKKVRSATRLADK